MRQRNQPHALTLAVDHRESRSDAIRTAMGTLWSRLRGHLWIGKYCKFAMNLFFAWGLRQDCDFLVAGLESPCYT